MITSVPLVPKVAGGPLRVIIIGRVSTIHQPESNISAGYEYARQYLDGVYDGLLEIKELGERASGMLVERATIMEAADEIATGEWDLVLMEDISKTYRNPRWMYAFVQDSFDAETRVIAPGDNLDTAEDNWEVNLAAAALRHGLHIPDTRRKVLRTADHSFHHGGMVQKVRFGYRKLTPEEADSGEFGPKGLRIAKRPEQTKTLCEMASRVIRGDSYNAIADWLNEDGIPTGPYAGEKWTGKLVVETLRDEILIGTRTFGKMKSTLIYRTGKYKRRKNPSSPLKESYLELAHFSPELHERLMREIQSRTERNLNNGGRDHPRYNVPRSRSFFPAQHARCAICGGLMYRYDTDQLKCQNSLPSSAQKCWNHVQVSCERARLTILAWLLRRLDEVPRFREHLTDVAWNEYQRVGNRNERCHGSLEKRIRDVENRARNLVKAIGMGGKLKPLVAELESVNATLEQLCDDRIRLQEREDTGMRFKSRNEIADHLDVALYELAACSHEFADVMRRILPQFEIVPVQAFDSGLVRPRARLTLRITNDINGVVDVNKDGDIDEVNVVLDLFDPPKHLRFLRGCREAKIANPKLSLKGIGRMFELSYMTVKRCLDMARRMEREGLSDPYQELTTKPESASRWKL